MFKICFKLIIITISIWNISLYASTVDEYKQDKEEIELRRRQVEVLLNSAKKQENQIIFKLSEISEQEKEISEEIEFVKKRINELSAELQELQTKKENLEETLGEKIPVIEAHLVQLYKRQGLDYSRVLFNTESFNQFIRKYKVMKKVLREELILVDAMKSDLKEFIKVEEKIKKQQEELQIFFDELENKEKSYKKIIEEQEKLLIKASNEKEELEKRYETINQDYGEIVRIIQEKTKTPDKEDSKEDKGQKEEEDEKELEFHWPLTALRQIILSYGRQENEFNTLFNNQGIDIEVNSNDWVLASASGSVVYIGGMSGLGKVLIIRHSDEFTTVYTYLDDIFARIGQPVETGDRMATVLTDDDQEAKLHFEIRKNGEPVDPEKYLIIGE
ncbi:MAG: murein hydrolase activator EnvC family protein [Candidatus Muiribacteriota bacterium]